MSSLPAVTGQRLIKALRKIGFEVVRKKGSHNFLQHPDGRCTVVPVGGIRGTPYSILNYLLEEKKNETTHQYDYAGC